MNTKKSTNCDYSGTCKNKAYREVYPKLMKGQHKGKGWSYLCRRHYFEEQKKYKGKLPSCSLN